VLSVRRAETKIKLDSPEIWKENRSLFRTLIMNNESAQLRS